MVASVRVDTLRCVTTPATAPKRSPYRKADQVKDDLVAATVELLSERLPGQVTVREIAERAGVQHSMISRHFGSKSNLVAQAVASVAGDYAASVARAEGPAEGFVRGLQHLRDSPAGGLVLAAPAAVRAGDDEMERFPGFAAHIRQMLLAGEPDDDRTRVLAGLAVSLVIAWSAMRDTVVDAAGMDRRRVGEIDDLADEMLLRMVESQLRA